MAPPNLRRQSVQETHISLTFIMRFEMPPLFRLCSKDEIKDIFGNQAEIAIVASARSLGVTTGDVVTEAMCPLLRLHILGSIHLPCAAHIDDGILECAFLNLRHQLLLLVVLPRPAGRPVLGRFFLIARSIYDRPQEGCDGIDDLAKIVRDTCYTCFTKEAPPLK